MASSIRGSWAGPITRPTSTTPCLTWASQIGLVGIIHDAANSHDPNAMAVRGVANKTIYTAGYLPRALAAVLAPLVGPGGAANAAVIETVSRGGTRIGLKIIATVGRDMMVKSVSR